LTVGQNSVVSGGTVIEEGSSPVIERGVCWNTSPEPGIENDRTTDGSGPGTFVSQVSGLSASTLYHLRAYARNSTHTAYGEEQTFLTLNPGEPCQGVPLVEYEGKVYHTVQVGSQCWLRENLNAGTRVNSGVDQDPANGLTEKYCYQDLESNCDVYGGLYQWDEMMQGSTGGMVQGICPPGWHLPDNLEFQALAEVLGGDSLCGGKMKERGYIHWIYPNSGATNESGLTVLPAGIRNSNTSFGNLRDHAYFWVSTEYSNPHSFYRFLSEVSDDLFQGYVSKENGMSIRCLQN
jgi:uncharacterized protein (TIGR02145 family)